jgi:SAM-dependent methyltransferase
VAPLVRGERMLDVGVGAGRTIPLMRLVTDEYVAVDYSAAMVERCRNEYPNVEVRRVDARDLSVFKDGQFAFVFFSFNGIDGLDHDGRRRALAEFHRVLRPGGVLVFSTLNRNGPAFNTRPWRDPSRARSCSRLRHALRYLSRAREQVPLDLRRWRNWWRVRRLFVDHGDWAMSPLHSHEFGLVVHFTTWSEERRELEALGFEQVRAFAGAGFPIRDDEVDGRDDVGTFHVAGRKPESLC